MTVQERLSRLALQLPDDRAEALMRHLESEEPSPSESARLTGIRALEAILQETADHIPEEDLKRIPEDYSENLDHYLYGSPKR